MSGLFSSLNQTVVALNAQSRGIEVAGRNLANVNNPDYARQRVIFGDRGTVLTPTGAESLGLEAKSVQQIRDSLIDRQLAREIGLEASLSAEDDAYTRAQAALGESIDRTDSTDATSSSGEGISAALGEFFNAVQSFAARPTDQGERQNLLQRADILAQRFRLTDTRLEQVQSDIGAQIEADVDEVNGLLSSIAELNAQIGRMEVNAAGSAVDLRDQRQAQIEKLAAKIGAETRSNATQSGQVDVFVRDASGAEVVLVSLAQVVSPVGFDGTALSAGGTALAPTGGSINGLLTARDGAIQTLRDQLSAFAGQLAGAVNAAYNPTGATGDFFAYDPADPAASLTLASGLSATTLKASDGGAAGDNTLALALADLASKKFSTAGGDAIDGTFAQFFSGVVSDLGRAVSGTASRLEDQENIKALVLQQRQSVSGVSMDEEMADLLKFQRAFEASGKVVAIIDGLLDVVVNRLVRT